MGLFVASGMMPARSFVPIVAQGPSASDVDLSWPHNVLLVVKLETTTDLQWYYLY